MTTTPPRYGEEDPWLPHAYVCTLSRLEAASQVSVHIASTILYPELGQRLSIEEMLARIPEAQEVAHVEGETSSEWGVLRLVHRSGGSLPSGLIRCCVRIPHWPGVVVTHGTATLEETAYFLHLTVKSAKPVVVTGAMRPPTAVGTDADLNLLDAIRLASWPTAGGRGVLTVLRRDSECPGCHQDERLPGGDLYEPRAGLPGLCRCGCTGGLVSRCDSSTYHGDTV